MFTLIVEHPGLQDCRPADYAGGWTPPACRR